MGSKTPPDTPGFPRRSVKLTGKERISVAGENLRGLKRSVFKGSYLHPYGPGICHVPLLSAALSTHLFAFPALVLIPESHLLVSLFAQFSTLDRYYLFKS